MASDNVSLSDEKMRRKRVDRLKKIIIITVLLMIIIPTLLCVILFIRISAMNKEIKDMKSVLASLEKRYEDTYPLNDDKVMDTVMETEEETFGKANADTIIPNSRPVTDEKSEVSMVEEALSEGRKVVYLTFDDGPSKNTGKILDVLKKYNVKATFFDIKNPYYDEYVKRAFAEGHTIAMHTLTHDYTNVYSSVDNFKKEVNSIREYLEALTGEAPFIFRFPGGSSNSHTKIPITEFIKYLDSREIVYYDWNVSSGDGGMGQQTPEQIYDNVMKGIESQDISVVLLHDSEFKNTTIEAMPMIIEKLQEMKALILPITKDSSPVQHNINQEGF